MSDKEKMKKAFQNLKAPEDTLERVMETMSRKELRENMRSGQRARVGQSVRTKRLALTLAAVLVLALGCGSVYAVKGFSLGALFGQPDAKAELALRSRRRAWVQPSILTWMQHAGREQALMPT